MERVEKVLTFIWHVTLLFVIGAIFNTTIAFVSLFAQELTLIVPVLTGYGIYNLYKGMKNGSLQSSSKENREQSQ